MGIVIGNTMKIDTSPNALQNHQNPHEFSYCFILGLFFFAVVLQISVTLERNFYQLFEPNYS